MKKYLASLGIILLIFGVGNARAQGQQPPQPGQQPQQLVELRPGVARVSFIHGDVSLQRGDNGEWVAATLNIPIVAGDRVSTGPKSRAEIQLDWADILRMSDDTTANVATLNRTRIQVQVGQGLVSYSVLEGSEANLEIDTPNAAVHPLGEGEYRILIKSNAETEVIVRNGAAEVSTPQGSTRVEKEQMITVAGTNNPEYKIVSAPGRDDWDSWNIDRDKRISRAESWRHTNRYYSASEDLDSYGTWTEVPGSGPRDEYEMPIRRDPRMTAAPPAQMPLPPQLAIKPGTFVSVRVNQLLSSDRNQPGDAFSSTLVQPVVVDGVVVAERGQTLGGRVVEAQKAGRVQGVSQLAVQLTELSLADGQQLPIQTQLISLSGPSSQGRDAAAIASTTGMGAAIGAAADWGRGAAIGAGAGAVAGIVGVLLTRGHETVIYPESVLTFRVQAPVTISTERAPQAFRYAEREDYDRPHELQTRLAPVPYGYGAPVHPYYYYYGPGFGFYYRPWYYYGPGFYFGRGYYRGYRR
jgi:hypothetical protein